MLDADYLRKWVILRTGSHVTAGWQLEVADEHGKLRSGAFNQEPFAAAWGEMRAYRSVRITGDDLLGCGEHEPLFALLGAMRDLSTQAGVFWIGADLLVSPPCRVGIIPSHGDSERDERESVIVIPA